METTDSMTNETKEKIENLNNAAEQMVQSYDQLRQEAKNHKNDKACKELLLKVDKAYESCANQQQVAREVFTQADDIRNTKELRPLSYTVPKQLSKEKSYVVKSNPASEVELCQGQF